MFGSTLIHDVLLVGEDAYQIPEYLPIEYLPRWNHNDIVLQGFFYNQLAS